MTFKSETFARDEKWRIRNLKKVASHGFYEICEYFEEFLRIFLKIV